MSRIACFVFLFLVPVSVLAGTNVGGGEQAGALPGACCNADGTCTLILQSDCTGQWLGQGTTCAPNPCPQPYNNYYFSGPTTGYPGEAVTLAVAAVTNPAIKGYSVALQWDPSEFQYVSGPTFGGTLGEGAMIALGSHTSSSILCGVVVAPACPPSIPPGGGLLCYFTLQVQANALTGPTALRVINLPPALNRLTACSGTTLVPTLTDEQFNIVQAGACCRGDSCRIATPSDCAGAGANYLGNGVACNPNPCLQSSSAGMGLGRAAPDAVSAAPNPSRGNFVISYRLAVSGESEVEIFNAAGTLVRRILPGTRTAGMQTVRWDGRDDFGRALSSGIYLTRVRTASGIHSGRMEIIR